MPPSEQRPQASHAADLLGRLKIDSLRATGVLLDLVTDLLAIGQITQVRAPHCRDVNVNVLRSVIRRDEAETPGRIEEFYGSCGLVAVVPE